MIIRHTWVERIGVYATVLLVLCGHAAAARAAQWTIDTARSKLGFSGTQVGTTFHGTFKRYTVKINFDPTDLADSSVHVEIDPASATTGDPQRDATLPATEWFDVAHFPKIVFDATSIRSTGTNAFEADGKLTIRNVTLPFILPFTLVIDGASAHAIGHAELIRTDFGVGQGPWTSGDFVGLKVGVDIDVAAMRVQATAAQ
jgi:polyisoprenoid-binding protein YceI